MPTRDTIIPFKFAKGITQDEIHLDLTRAQLKDLPEYRPDWEITSEILDALWYSWGLRPADLYFVDMRTEDGVVVLSGHTLTGQARQTIEHHRPRHPWSARGAESHRALRCRPGPNGPMVLADPGDVARHRSGRPAPGLGTLGHAGVCRPRPRGPPRPPHPALGRRDLWRSGAGPGDQSGPQSLSRFQHARDARAGSHGDLAARGDLRCLRAGSVGRFRGLTGPHRGRSRRPTYGATVRA